MSTPDPTATSGAGSAARKQNQSIENFAASLSTAAIIFGIQIGVFLILSGNWKLHKGRAKKPVEGDQGDKAATRQSLFHKI
jgi:hypothetical protein